METRKFDKNPLLEKIIPVALLDAVGMLFGVLAILFVEPNGLTIGIGIIAATAVVSGWMIVNAIRNVNCPKCGQNLNRNQKQKGFECRRCGIRWEFSGK